MPGHLKIISGLPGSGKSTIAAKIAAETGATIVNMDTIREELFGTKIAHAAHSSEEGMTHEMHDATDKRKDMLIREALLGNETVVSDDTNLNTRTIGQLVRIAEQCGATYEFIPVDVPVDVALDQNEARAAAGGRYVPRYVIRRMYRSVYDPVSGKMNKLSHGKDGSFKYETRKDAALEDYNKIIAERYPVITREGKKPLAVLVDIDGTLANNWHMAINCNLSGARKRPNGKSLKKNFDKFFGTIRDMPINREVLNHAVTMRENDGVNIIILTGRSTNYSESLIHFIQRSQIPATLVVAKTGDHAENTDAEFKSFVLDWISEEFEIIAAIDDRKSSVKNFQSRGIHVEQVQEFSDQDGQESLAPFRDVQTDFRYGSGVCVACAQTMDVAEYGVRGVCNNH